LRDIHGHSGNCEAVGLERDATNDNVALYIRDAAGRNSGTIIIGWTDIFVYRG
jgi:hypothetical protein